MTPTCTASLTGAQLLLLVLLTGLVGHRSVAQEDDIVEVDPTESMLLDMLENVHVLLEFQDQERPSPPDTPPNDIQAAIQPPSSDQPTVPNQPTAANDVSPSPTATSPFCMHDIALADEQSEPLLPHALESGYGSTGSLEPGSGSTGATRVGYGGYGGQRFVWLMTVLIVIALVLMSLWFCYPDNKRHDAPTGGLLLARIDNPDVHKQPPPATSAATTDGVVTHICVLITVLVVMYLQYRVFI